MSKTTYTETMLTTEDNPYNPFEDFDKWFVFDEINGYHSCALLARFLKTSDSLPENIIAEQTEEAIDEIIACDMTGMYRKATRESVIDWND